MAERTMKNRRVTTPSTVPMMIRSMAHAGTDWPDVASLGTSVIAIAVMRHQGHGAPRVSNRIDTGFAKARKQERVLKTMLATFSPVYKGSKALEVCRFVTAHPGDRQDAEIEQRSHNKRACTALPASPGTLKSALTSKISSGHA